MIQTAPAANFGLICGALLALLGCGRDRGASIPPPAPTARVGYAVVASTPTPDASAVLAAALTALPRSSPALTALSGEQVFAVPSPAPTAKREHSVAKGDPRVRVISPADGQIFAPGDTVNATVQLTAPLAAGAGWLGVGAPGLGVLEGTNYNGSSYQVSFAIPDDYAGPLELTPDITDSSGNPIEGVGVTIVVRPFTGPLRLSPVEAHFHLRSIGQKGRIYVWGNYPGARTLDLTSSASGTVYDSSDPHVIAVDGEGNVKATGLGTASVRATNQGAKTFFTFAVEDVAHPLAPQDLTAGVRFEKALLTLDAKATAEQGTPIYIQTVTVINTSGWPIVGPLYLSVQDLSKDGWLWGWPVGEPVYFLRLEPKDGVTLGSDERVTRLLQFVGLRSHSEPSHRLGLVRSAVYPGRRWP